MYFNILKRDLKRKKTMNIILLLFTILATIFVSSGMNNVVTVIHGTEYFLDKAGIGDYMVITQNMDNSVERILKKSEYVTDYKTEPCLFASKEDVKLKHKKVEMKNNICFVQSLSGKGIRYFLPDNAELTEVKPGEVYVTTGFLQENHGNIGDVLQIQLGNKTIECSVAGEIKDALLGSDMMGNIRFLISDSDCEKLKHQENITSYQGEVFYINSSDVRSLSSELSKASNMLFNGTRSVIKQCYIMETIMAMLVLVLSVCLVIVSFVILKFVITFSINEEFREIGVMKAIGIKNRKIRSLYLTKYFFVAAIGGGIGFILSIPFGNRLMLSVSKKMVLGNDSGIWLNLAGALLVIALMIGYTYLCTGKVKKYTPLDAIRDGQRGERYKKKSACSLCNSHTNGVLYLAINDVVSAPKRFITIILCFFLCSVFVLGIVVVTDTMGSKNLITTFGKEADVYITEARLLKMDLMGENGNEKLREKYKEIEEKLEEYHMPGTVSMEVWYKYNCQVKGKSFAVTFQQNTETKASDYTYIEGSAPENADEIAITPMVSERIGANIGDIVTIDFGSEKRDCMVVGYFQTMNQLGEVIRLHEDAPTSMEYASAMMAYQIDFKDHPSQKEIQNRIKTLKEIYHTEDVLDAAGYCRDCIGVVDTMEMVEKLLLLIVGIVVILVTVLMERSFISDEVSQIALLKALGFQNRKILAWHIDRFMIVGLIAELLAIIFVMPVTKLWCDPIWNMMGATKVAYCFRPVSVLVVTPGIILLITFVSVALTALYTRKISSKDIRNIE